MAKRNAQLVNGSVVVERENILLGKLSGYIALFSNSDNRIVGCYSLAYANYANIDVEYLLSKLETWSNEHPGFTVLLSRDLVKVNDTNFYRLYNGKWYSVDSNVYSNIHGDLQCHAGIYGNVFARYVVTRVDLAVILAPMGIIETTESVITECKLANAQQAAIQRSGFQQHVGMGILGNPQNNLLR